jgi:hypothetical protein
MVMVGDVSRDPRHRSVGQGILDSAEKPLAADDGNEPGTRHGSQA